MRFEIEDYPLIKYTRGVRKVIIGANGKPACVPEEIIIKLKKQMVDGFVILNKTLKRGDNVIISKGPFKGFDAIFLEEVKPDERVLILLNTISGELKVEIDKVNLKIDN